MARNTSKVSRTVSDIAVMERPVVRTAALEACYYPVDPIINPFDGSLDSGLLGPVSVTDETPAIRAASFLAAYSDQTSRSIYNPSYDPATPHKIVSRETQDEVPEIPDVLAPYYGKRVELLFLAGRNHVTGKNIEASLGECAATEARKLAIQHSADSGMSMIIRCLETGGNIDIVSCVKQKTSRTATRTVKAEKPVKVLTPEEIEAQEIAEWIAAHNAAILDNAKFDQKREKERQELAANLKKAMAAAENAAQKAMFMRPQGATPKEQNYAWNARNPDKVAEKGPANFGWKQRAQDFVKGTTDILLQTSRPCEASQSEGKFFIGPAFRIIKEGETIPAGWYAIPTK